MTGYAQVVEELRSNIGVVKSYTYGLDLISQKQGAIVSFYNYDGHGSVRNLSNASGNLTDSYDYDAFGNLIAQTGNTSNSYLYAGEQFDADLGFYYNRARYLNVETGRFLSMDSYEGDIEDALSLHKYLYAKANGVNGNDPTGNYTLSQVTTSSADYARFQAQYSQMQMTAASRFPLATVNASSALSIVGGVSARAVGFAVSFALSMAATAALQTLKERFEEDDKYEFVTLYRHASRLNAGAFTIGAGDNDGYLSVWKDFPARLPREGSSEKPKYNVPMPAMFEKPIRIGSRGFLIHPFIDTVTPIYNPLDSWENDPNGHLHYSLEYFGSPIRRGEGFQGDIPQRLADHALRLGLKRGEFKDPYAALK